jgi:radical SAM protein with 4Fe4S-binding SPASM domain
MSRYVKRVPSASADLWRRKGPTLVHLDIELTERCENDCLHCYINRPAGDEQARKREMSASRIKSILSEAASLGCLSVRFTGGEPLLRTDFEEIYLFARKLGLRVTIFTNAAPINPRLADLLASTPPLEPLEITVYGMTTETYESVTRTKGSFAKAMAGIDLLVDRKIPFVVKGAFLPSNGGDVQMLEEWAAGIPWMDEPPSVSVFFVKHARRDVSKNEMIERMRPDPERGVDVLARNPERYVRYMKDFLTRFAGGEDDRIFSCGAGVESCSVDAYGMLQPCLLVRHPEAVYDLGKGSLKEAVEKFFPDLRKRKASDPRYLKTCAVCPLRGFCEQCPAKSWMEHGTLDTPVDYFCEVAHVQARRFGLLREGERAWEVADWASRLDNFSEAEALNRLTAAKKNKGDSDGRKNRT